MYKLNPTDINIFICNNRNVLTYFYKTDEALSKNICGLLSKNTMI